MARLHVHVSILVVLKRAGHIAPQSLLAPRGEFLFLVSARPLLQLSSDPGDILPRFLAKPTRAVREGADDRAHVSIHSSWKSTNSEHFARAS